MKRPLTALTVLIVLALSLLATQSIADDLSSVSIVDDGSGKATVQPVPTLIADVVKESVNRNPDFAEQIGELHKQESIQMEVRGTEYTLGQVALPFVQIFNRTTGISLDNQACYISIYSPNASKTQMLNRTPMVSLGQDGLYYYSFTPTEIGNHMTAAVCTVNTEVFTSYSRTDTLNTGTQNSGTLISIHAFDGADVGYTNVNVLAPVQTNLTSNFTMSVAVTNVTAINVYSVIRSGTTGGVTTRVTTQNMTLCLFDYSTKTYSCTASTLCGRPGSEMALCTTTFTPSNSSGWPYLNSVTGVLSAELNTVTQANTLPQFFLDWFDAQIIQPINSSEIVNVRGGGEVHVSANDTLTIIAGQTANTNVLLQDSDDVKNLIRFLIELVTKFWNSTFGKLLGEVK